MATGILADFIDRPSLAEQLKCSEKTIARYETQPDGLPYVMIAGRKWYRIPEVVAWIGRREHRPNRRRAA
ncbi:MAG: hypothetical protein RBU25_19535 [Lentisphaeria bacterium]|jgi:hypothetical protein|nr:hypothetical protein [Lentisphaeria bacterium]